MRSRPRGTQSTSAERVLVDSGAWIALVSATDGRHAQAETLFRRALRERVPLLTTNLIVAETHRFLLHRAGRSAARAVLLRIDNSPLMHVEFTTAEHHARACEWLTRLRDQPLTYTDAVSFAVMQATQCTSALTFDHHFTIAGFPRWQA